MLQISDLNISDKCNVRQRPVLVGETSGGKRRDSTWLCGAHHRRHHDNGQWLRGRRSGLASTGFSTISLSLHPFRIRIYLCSRSPMATVRAANTLKHIYNVTQRFFIHKLFVFFFNNLLLFIQHCRSCLIIWWYW